MQARISATIDSQVQQFAKNFSKKNNISLSQVFEMGLKLLQQKSLQEQLKKGYLADKKEAINWAKASLKITNLNDEV